MTRPAIINRRRVAQTVNRSNRSRDRTTPPLRLIRRDERWHTVDAEDTNRPPPLRLVRRHGQWQSIVDDKDCPDRLVIRKRTLSPPTAVEQKRARWELISLVSAFSF